MTKFSRKGFTLIELLVVVIILGILASMAMPYYFKTIETSKANDSIAIGHLLGNSNRMWNLDKGGSNFTAGQITDTCNTSNCPPTTNTSPCNLVSCNYVAKQDWQQSGGASYLYYVCNPRTGAGGGCCSRNAASCVMRSPTASVPYQSWGYSFTDSGQCTAFGTDVPSCPKF